MAPIGHVAASAQSAREVTMSRNPYTKSWRLFPFLFCLLAALATQVAQWTLAAQQKPSFTVGWSVYVGWDPYYYLAKSGILRKWSDKYGIEIKVQRFDYAPSLD